MLFGVVSEVGRGMGVLDGVDIVERKGAVLGVSVGHILLTTMVLVFYAVQMYPGIGLSD